MQAYYKAHQQVLDLMVKRDKLWNEMLEFEVRGTTFFLFFECRVPTIFERTGMGIYSY